MKTCKDCNVEFSLDRFYPSKNGRLGVTTLCRPCHNAASAASYKRNPGSKRNGVLKRRYGISQETYEAMLQAQSGGCSLCGKTKPGGRMSVFAVDHSHATGKVRGLLCTRCNTQLHALENVEYLKNALRYLRDTDPSAAQAVEAILTTV